MICVSRVLRNPLSVCMQKSLPDHTASQTSALQSTRERSKKEQSKVALFDSQSNRRLKNRSIVTATRPLRNGSCPRSPPPPPQPHPLPPLHVLWESWRLASKKSLRDVVKRPCLSEILQIHARANISDLKRRFCFHLYTMLDYFNFLKKHISSRKNLSTCFSRSV